MKTQQKEIDNIYAEFNTWSRDGINEYIGLIEKELKRIKRNERRSRYHDDTDDVRGTQYEQLEKEVRKYLLVRNKYRYITQQDIRSVYSFIYERMARRKLYSDSMFEMIHRKIFLELALEKARLEYSKYFGVGQ